MTRYAVVGAGIIGSSIAWRLAARGGEVTLIDGRQPGTLASGRSFAWVGAGHPGLHLTPEYFAMNAAGVAAYRELELELGVRPWYVRNGCLIWYTSASDQQEQARFVASLQTSPYPSELLSRSEVLQRFDDPLRIDPGVDSVAWFPDDAHVYGRPMAEDMTALAGGAGAELILGDAVVRILTHAGEATGVVLASGREVMADVIVISNGADCNAVLSTGGDFEIPMVDPRVPESDAVGLIVETSPLTVPLERVVLANDMMMRPGRAGGLLLHDYVQDKLVTVDTPAEPVPQPAQSALDGARPYLDGIDDVVVATVQIGVRPLAIDHLPVIGWVPGVPGVYVAMTHSGVTLGPLISRIVAQEVVDDVRDPLVRYFGPERFETRSA